ncbi:hypothetical protein [Tersicoccus solisilvae]|nr:hypothetical protein [Tersicoccus solisilvae]
MAASADNPPPDPRYVSVVVLPGRDHPVAFGVLLDVRAQVINDLCRAGFNAGPPLTGGIGSAMGLVKIGMSAAKTLVTLVQFAPKALRHYRRRSLYELRISIRAFDDSAMWLPLLRVLPEINTRLTDEFPALRLSFAVGSGRSDSPMHGISDQPVRLALFRAGAVTEWKVFRVTRHLSKATAEQDIWVSARPGFVGRNLRAFHDNPGKASAHQLTKRERDEDAHTLRAIERGEQDRKASQPQTTPVLPFGTEGGVDSFVPASDAVSDSRPLG